VAKTALDPRPPAPPPSGDEDPPSVAAVDVQPEEHTEPAWRRPLALTALAVASAAVLHGIDGLGGGGGDVPDIVGGVTDAAADGASVGALQMFGTVLGDPHFVVSLGLAVSAFVQALTGFGFAIVSVGALTQVPWIAHSSIFETVQPIAATLSGIIGLVLVGKEYKLVQWRRIAPAILASTVMSPVGALALNFVDADLVLRILGGLIAGYVMYASSDVKVPKVLGGTVGSLVLGGLAGFFGGAFDISGPPLVILGQAAGWGDSFRRNLLAICCVNSAVVVTYDLATNRMADYYYADFLKFAIPGVVAGVLAGQYFTSKLDPSGFRKIVLGTCLVMGVRLMLS
jgi:uncharacterized protein